MASNFFAMHSRMKYINRWALMRNTTSENISEHSNDVAAIAHALAIIGNVRYGKQLNAERAAFLGLYHDMPEIITGDMPTPIKYHSEKMRSEFDAIEKEACETLLGMLPDDLRAEYESAFFKQADDEYLWKLVKAADKLSALIKCIEEQKAGNSEFSHAFKATQKSLDEMDLPEVKHFVTDFLSGFYLSLDEMNR